MRQHPGAPDAAVGVTDEGYGHPTLDVAAHQQLGLLPFLCEVDGYVFKRKLQLKAKEDIHRHKKGEKQQHCLRQDSRYFFFFSFSAI